MRKLEEFAKLNSCLNKANRDEMMFVFLGRDPAAPSAIEFWCKIRIEMGKNKPTDPQIIEALLCADTMRKERRDALFTAQQ